MIRPTTKQAYEFFRDLTQAFATIEDTGIRINVPYLDQAIIDVQKNIDKAEDELKQTNVYKEWRKRFANPNLESTTQLAEILFTVMGHKVTEYSQGSYNPDGSLKEERFRKAKADERAIERVKDPFVAKFIQCKKLRKVLGTYLKGIKRETIDGFLHPSYNLAGGLDDEKKGGAMSYRGSSSDPNFQNLPIRNKTTGKWIRECFIARDGYVLGEIDFSTIEVRVAACVTKDRNLIRYVKDKTKDMHRDTAMDMFFMTAAQVGKKTTRDACKNRFVFPQFYGSYYIDCTKNIWEMMERGDWNVEGSDVKVIDHLRKHGIYKRGMCDENTTPKKGTFEAHVKEVERIFWNERFPEYTAWKKKWYNKYLETAEVPMPTGFTAKGPYRKNQVLNLPIQGPAFHCLGWSIIEINKEIKRRKMKSRIVGQIHDCILADIYKSEIQEVLHMLKDIMTVRLPKAWPWIIVPLETEVDIAEEGQSWNDKAPWHQNKDNEWVLKV